MWEVCQCTRTKKKLFNFHNMSHSHNIPNEASLPFYFAEYLPRKTVCHELHRASCLYPQKLTEKGTLWNSIKDFVEIAGEIHWYNWYNRMIFTQAAGQAWTLDTIPHCNIHLDHPNLQLRVPRFLMHDPCWVGLDSTFLRVCCHVKLQNWLSKP